MNFVHFNLGRILRGLNSGLPTDDPSIGFAVRNIKVYAVLSFTVLVLLNVIFGAVTTTNQRDNSFDEIVELTLLAEWAKLGMPGC